MPSIFQVEPGITIAIVRMSSTFLNPCRLDDDDLFILRYVTGRRPAHAGKAI